MALLDEIRQHYDVVTPYYRIFWGEHIHHGYWKGRERPREAQENLIRMLSEFAGVARGDLVLDVGCGLGGTSLFLTREMNCITTGISISPVQVKSAQKAARRSALQGQTHFVVADAARLPFSGPVFDVVWVVECSEHLENKEAFFQSLLPLLKAGGRIAAAAWVRTEDHPLVDSVCKSFLCPGLATMEEYSGWIPNARVLDVTERVTRTWRICRTRALPFKFLPLSTTQREFVNGFRTIERAYSTGKMRYVLVAGTRQIGDDDAVKK
jgi:tocopherol O-methyltransferase